jgi:L-seryl-tRNA(Ser) seleniumtransferase
MAKGRKPAPKVPARSARQLPAVGKVLTDPRVRALEERLGHTVTVRLVREAIDGLRGSLASPDPGPSVEAACASVLRVASRMLMPSLRRVINATGIIVHTNLGRAPLSPAAVAHLARVAQGYTNLEFDLATGKRGSRQNHLRQLLRLLVDAPDILVVNNNAAAVLLVIRTLAAGREVIVSRGELIEIGDSFRLPEIMKTGGARLVEVGTTNRTRLGDYEAAITDETALLFKAHTSNFKTVGFTAEVGIAELGALAKTRGIPCVFDLGSGLLRRSGGVALEDEPCVQEALQAGADLITFSGDKLLGGPQAGLIAGRKDLLARLARAPMMRAMRPGRLTLAALEAVVLESLDRRLAEAAPIPRMLSRSQDELRQTAERVASRLSSGDLRSEIVASTGQVGGGALPTMSLPGWAIKLVPRDAALARSPRTSAALFSALLAGDPPVLAVLREGSVCLDVRTLCDGEEETLVASVRAAFEHVLATR